MPAVKAVFLDVGWTVVYPLRSMWEVLAEVSAEAGAPLAAAEAERIVHRLMMAGRAHALAQLDGGAAYTDSDAEFGAQFDAMSRAVFAVGNVPGDRTELGARFLARFWTRQNWQAFPDALAGIRRLRAAGVRVGVLSNASSDLLLFLERCGLLPHFDFTVVSAIEGIKKPDRRIFERAVAAAGVRAADAVHVGDMYVEDILGARKAGIRPLLMDRGAQGMFPNHPEVAAHPPETFEVVRDLDGVLAAIGVA